MIQDDPGFWRPPSNRLRLVDGIWTPGAISDVSYPDEGNDLCYLVEDSSYWFSHRNHCIIEVVRQFPPLGPVYDIGGGNGVVAFALQQLGLETILIEPGSGARNAVRRGVKNVIQCTLGDAGLAPGSLSAAGAFDVVEHIDDDVDFVRDVARLLRPGGRFYCTVPALSALWSEEDRSAGHFRRYSAKSLKSVVEQAGMEVEFMTGLFSWLVAPIFVLRALPARFRRSSRPDHDEQAAIQADHSLPAPLATIAAKVHSWELSRLQRRLPVPLGTSLLCVARTAR